MVRYENMLTYLSKDSVSIVGKHDTSHWVEKHFQHALWSKSSSDDICDSLFEENLKKISTVKKEKF